MFARGEVPVEDGDGTPDHGCEMREEPWKGDTNWQSCFRKRDQKDLKDQRDGRADFPFSLEP